MYGSVMGGSGVVKINKHLGVAAPTDQEIAHAEGQEIQPPTTIADKKKE